MSPPEPNAMTPNPKKLRTRIGTVVATDPKSQDGRVKIVPKSPKNKENSKRSRPEAVLIKPAEGLSYAEIVQDLKTLKLGV